MKKFGPVLFVFILFVIFSFQPPRNKKQDPAFISIQNKWVDSVFYSLSPDERIAQLFMVAAYSNLDMKHVKEIRELINNYKIGGLIWMQGGPVRQGKLANYYQSISKVPLLYSIDGEWGLAMRLDSTPRYPKQMTLGAIQNDSLIYKMGRQIGKECRRIGLHVNFAPVADVNNNPLNPVIGMRSFGENKYKVAQKSYMYMLGMQDEFIMANGKHFPGHGDTESDSHLSLPYMPQTKERLDSIELYPFKYLFDRGLASVMVAHLSIPSLDTTKNLASTLSTKVVNDLLKNEMGYKGLIFTDALSMQGVTKFYPQGEVEVRSLMAGNDVLLFSGNVAKAMTAINKAIKDGRLSRDEIEERCKRVLRAKFWCGLGKKPEIVTRNLTKDLNTKESEDLNDRLAEGAITLLKNDKGILPLKGTDTMKILEISFGVEEENLFGATLKYYSYAVHTGIAHNAKEEDIKQLFEKIKEADMVVMQANKATLKADNNYGISDQSLRLMDSIAGIKPSVLVMFANPYLINKIPSFEKFGAVILAYEYIPSLLKAAANAVVGLSNVNGKLPVTTSQFKYGTGLELVGKGPGQMAVVKENFRNNKFGLIDSIALSGISEKAYPGCQVVALKDGKIIYQKSFGAFTYNADSKKVDNGTIYDLASLTKIAASSLALMKLRSEGKFDYHNTLGSYLPQLKGTDKENLVIEDVLSHQAGLQAWIPFYLRTLKKNSAYKPGYYSATQSENYPTPVARNLWVVKGFKDTIYNRIIASKIENPGKYLYSDIGYYFMQEIIENQTQKKLDEYVQDLYAKVGIGMTYHPLKYFSKLQIAPTENDEKFRKQVVQGYVHDPGAALLGGVAGHAGLFGNALDFAKLMQLYLNKGELNGVRLLDSNVVKEFTTCRFCPGNRRGLCFEKPEPDSTKDSPVTSDCSPESYGHSGFTGTFAWADPVNDLVVVFLSNRIYPSLEENKLAKLGIRGKIHKAFYEAIKK